MNEDTPVCNVCSENEPHNCFHACSYLICKDCMIKWVKIQENNDIVYECPQCKQKSKFILTKNITDSTPEYDKNFSKYCKENDLVEDIIEKFQQLNENSDDFDFGGVPIEISFQTSDPMLQAEAQSDIANILRHLPQIIQSRTPTVNTTTQTNVNTNTPLPTPRTRVNVTEIPLGNIFSPPPVPSNRRNVPFPFFGGNHLPRRRIYNHHFNQRNNVRQDMHHMLDEVMDRYGYNNNYF